MAKRIAAFLSLTLLMTLSGCVFFPHHDDHGGRGGHGHGYGHHDHGHGYGRHHR